MRFCDFFLEYKLRVLGINKYIRLRDVKKYKLVALVISLGLMCTAEILYVKKVDICIHKIHIYIYFYVVAIIGMFVTWHMINRKKEKEEMLIKHYKPYSKKRMTAFFKLLKEYGIDYNDEKKMNMLIEQAEQAKDKNNIIKVIKSRVNVVITYIFLPIFGCVVEHIIGNMKIDQAFIQMIIFVTWGLIMFGTVLVVLLIGNSIFGGYLQEYDDLKYDLQQAMIFGNPYGEIISTSF